MPAIRPVQRTQLTSQVIERVRSYIEDNNLNAGDKLPGERDLAKALGVSRNVTREALRALQATGILDIQPGNGAFVADFNYAEISGHLSFGIGRQPQQFKHWVEARAVIECAVMPIVAQYIKPSDLDKLEKTIIQMEQSESYDEDMAADLAFHRGLVEITLNPVLIEMVSFLGQFFSEASRIKGSSFGGADDHKKILDALRRKDADEAGRLMDAHIKTWIRK